ncbi:MAG: alpha/beta hydrolase fold domain-containing protein [Acidimicrobiia bacterium]|nr:alpha/beta hydrolase fold domain-containing protein [Acidimicrobiia bacterium]
MTSTQSPSTESEAQRALFHQFGERLTADPPLELQAIREMFEEFHTLAAEPTQVCYEEVDAGGVPAMWCLPVGAAQDRVMLFAHGGGFVTNGMCSHRKMAGHLAKAAGVRGLVIEYRRAPEHPYPAQLEDGITAYRWLLGQGIEAGHIFTAGDSAGGNLATTLPLKARAEGLPLPAAIVALSPWYDMEAKGETLVSNAATDALVRPGLAEGMTAMFLGETGSMSDPLANPLYADMAGMPPIFLTAGSWEALQDNADRMAAIARSAGVDTTLEIVPGMQHVFTFQAGRSPEADQTIATIGRWVRPKLGLG